MPIRRCTVLCTTLHVWGVEWSHRPSVRAMCPELQHHYTASTDSCTAHTELTAILRSSLPSLVVPQLIPSPHAFLPHRTRHAMPHRSTHSIPLPIQHALGRPPRRAFGHRLVAFASDFREEDARLVAAYFAEVVCAHSFVGGGVAGGAGVAGLARFAFGGGVGGFSCAGWGWGEGGEF